MAKKTDFDGFKFDKPYTGGKYKILMVASDERYLEMKNGKLFSTGNHPVETMLPMLHIHHAGFEIEVATLSGNSVKFEMWAMPTEDEAVMGLYETYLPKFKNPHKLADILAEVTAEDSPYLGVLIPGGHAALHGLPFSTDMKAVLNWAFANDKYIISLCHGPAAFLAASIGEKPEDFPFNGYEICVFPDALDECGYRLHSGQITMVISGTLRIFRRESIERRHYRSSEQRPQRAHRRQPTCV